MKVHTAMTDVAKFKMGTSRKVNTLWRGAKKALLQAEVVKAREHSNMSKAEK